MKFLYVNNHPDNNQTPRRSVIYGYEFILNNDTPVDVKEPEVIRKLLGMAHVGITKYDFDDFDIGDTNKDEVREWVMSRTYQQLLVLKGKYKIALADLRKEPLQKAVLDYAMNKGITLDKSCL